jgi:NADP-reducing hydrogenase subunit HndB
MIMEKMTQKEMKKMREKLSTKKHSGTIIRVGLGSCGIAAGAQEAYNVFASEIQKEGVEDIVVQQTGCMGLCYSEPTVEVIMPDMPTVIYGHVNGEVAKRILRKHVVGKTLVQDHIFDKPAEEISLKG